MSRRRLLSRYAWFAAFAAQFALALSLMLSFRLGWVLSLVLVIPLPWMARGSSYAHAANSLLIVVVLGGLVVFADDGWVRIMSVLAAVAFLASVFYVRWSAIERRAGLAGRTES